MTYLISIVVVIALSAIVAVLSFTNIGSGFSDRNAKGEAQNIIKKANEIQLAYDVYEIIHGGKMFKDENHLMDELIRENLIKNKTLNNSELFMGATSFSDSGSGFDLVLISQNKRVCQYINASIQNIDINDEIPLCSEQDKMVCCRG